MKFSTNFSPSLEYSVVSSFPTKYAAVLLYNVFIYVSYKHNTLFVST